MNWLPIGRPSEFHARGTDMAGWPVTLQIIVKHEYWLMRSRASAPDSGVQSK
jgi:hypothetical protein